MWIKMSQDYRKEVNNYNFKASCEDCAFFCKEKKLCAMLYPTTPHLKETFLNAKDDDRIYFCKMFEAK